MLASKPHELCHAPLDYIVGPNFEAHPMSGAFLLPCSQADCSILSFISLFIGSNPTLLEPIASCSYI